MGQNSITMFTNDSGSAAGPNAYIQDVFTDVTDHATTNSGLTDNANTNPMGNLWKNDFTPRYGVKTLYMKSLALLSDRSKWISNKPTYAITWDESFPQIAGYIFGNILVKSAFNQVIVQLKNIGDGISINGIVRRVAFITRPSSAATATGQVVVDNVNGTTVDFSSLTGNSDDPIAGAGQLPKFNAQVHASTNETKDIHDIRLTALQANTLLVQGVIVYFENSGYNLEVNSGTTYVNKSQTITSVGATLPLASYGSSLGGILNLYCTSNAGITYSALSATTIASAGTGSSGTNLFTVTTGQGASFLAGYGIVVPGPTHYLGVIQSVSTDTLTLYPTLPFGLSNIIYRAWSSSLAINASFMQLSQVLDFTTLRASPGVSYPIFGPKNAYCFWGNNNLGLTLIDSSVALPFSAASAFAQIDGYFSAAEAEFVGNGIMGFTVSINGLPSWSVSANSTGIVKRVLMNDAGPGWNSINIQAGQSLGAVGIARLNLYTRRPDIGVSYGSLASLETLQTFTDRGAANLSATLMALGTYRRIYGDQLYLQGNWVRSPGATHAGGVGYYGSTTNCKLFFQYYGKNFGLVGVGASVTGTLQLDGNTIGATFNQMLIGSTEQLHTVTFQMTGGTCAIAAVDFTRSVGELNSFLNFAPLPSLQTATSRVIHEISITGAAGWGSSGTAVRRFGAVRRVAGTAITFVGDSTNGDFFIINEDGVYAIVYYDGAGAATGDLGLSVNSTQLATTVDTIAAGNFLTRTVSVSGQAASVSWQGNLRTGDIIRAHSDGTMNNTTDNAVGFRITKVG